jgi:hypothetical protein
MLDPNLAFRNWIVQSAALIAMVPAAQIFGGALREGYDVESNGDAITIRTRGGPVEADVPVLHPSIQVTVFSPKNQYARARSIFGLIFDQVHAQNDINLGSAGYVIAAVAEMPGEDMVDPDTGWAMVVGFFTLLLRATA